MTRAALRAAEVPDDVTSVCVLRYISLSFIDTLPMYTIYTLMRSAGYRNNT